MHPSTNPALGMFFIGNTTGDSLECRTYHANFAGTFADGSQNRLLHCSHASVFSNSGVCGDKCDYFCDMEDRICMGSLYQYANHADCLTKCRAWAPGATTDTTGDTFGCRFYHLGAAALVSKTTHCPHTADHSVTCAPVVSSGSSSGTTMTGTMTGTMSGMSGMTAPATGTIAATGSSAVRATAGVLAVIALALL